MDPIEPPMIFEGEGSILTSPNEFLSDMSAFNHAIKGGVTHKRYCRWEDGNSILAHKAKVWNIEVDADLQLMATGGQDGDDRTDTVKLWDLKSGTLLKTMEGHERAVVALYFSPDGKEVASGSDDSTIRVWSTSSGELLRTLKHNDFVRDVRYSPNGQLMCSASWDATARIWRASDGECLKTLWGHQGWVWHSSFSPCGTKLSSTARDHCLRIWDVETGTCLKDVHTGHGGSVFQGQFNPAGDIICTASGDAKIKLWDARSYECIRTMEGHSGWTWRAEWSTDGAMLVSGSMDKSVRFWDVKDGRMIHKIDTGFDDAVSGVHFCGPNHATNQIVTSSLDGHIRLHDIVV